MSEDRRADWSRHIDQIIRSRHYTWIAEGLGGEPLETALVDITTDLMHICCREGISWEYVLSEAARQYEQEEESLQTREGHAQPLAV
jgi:hypothetical protein